MGTTTLLMVRHGQTGWNADGRIQGSSDVPLNAIGLEQAERVAGRLAAGWSDRISAIYTSDLARAATTANIIWDGLRQTAHAEGLPPSLRVTPSLREISYGVWEGKTVSELRHRGRGGALRRWQSGDWTALPPGAETKDRVLARVDRFLACVVPRHPGETVVVVGHGGTLRLMLCRLFGWPPTEWSRVRIGNTGLSKAVLTPGSGSQVIFVNDMTHLDSMHGQQLTGPLQRYEDEDVEKNVGRTF